MADKKKTGVEAPKVFTIEQLRSKKNVSRVIFAGVCAAESWKPGKTVTEAEFLEAVKNFNSAPMSGAVKKEAGK